MSEVKVDVSIPELLQEIGGYTVALGQARKTNEALNQLVVRLNERIRVLESENASLKNGEPPPDGIQV